MPFIIRAPTGKPIGSEYLTEFEPTALVVGAKKEAAQTFEKPTFFVAPTGKPIGSEYITEFEPTALVVGAKKEAAQIIETLSFLCLDFIFRYPETIGQ